MHIRKPVMPSLKLEGQPLVINPQAIQNRRLQIVDVNRIPHDVVTVIVGLPVGDATPDSATGQPDGETEWMVVTAVIVARQFTLAVNRATKLAVGDWPLI